MQSEGSHGASIHVNIKPFNKARTVQNDQKTEQVLSSSSFTEVKLC